MKARLTLQSADYETRDLGRVSVRRGVARFRRIPWDRLRREAARLRDAGQDWCPPGLYVEVSSIWGQEVSLHLYVPDPDDDRFDGLARETLGDDLAAQARRRAAPETLDRGLSPEAAAARLGRFLDDLDDTLLQPTGYEYSRTAVSRSDYRGGLLTLMAIVTVAALVCAVLLASLFLRLPAIRPDWFWDLMDALPWLHDLA
ncbi:hypothetical protein [Roseospira navarrensis]|uniref:Uncharacterized protein n=1 Tax=Roseospira navarrensis TaxID=140058 RepID=A0A7X1ZCU9_9PROT|nr:hypothetical protein [Roseospira navarrensis]MQX35659.1 hypothetical protein [Roseospira navarrensis]